MRQIYLSPHLDDAVLSCGGCIHRHTAAGERVLVITVFAGEFQGGQPSSFAEQQHTYWGSPSRPMAMRRAEDAAALASLGAVGWCLDYLDAVYRADPDGGWLYTDLETLFGDLHPADPMAEGGARVLADRLADLIPPGDGHVLYAPLAVGNHVDHQIVRAAAQRLLGQGQRLALYEDFPYAEQTAAVELALSRLGGEDWSSETIPLDPIDLAARVSAVGHYRSQLDVLFGGAEAMPNRLWRFAIASAASVPTGIGERIWWPPGV